MAFLDPKNQSFSPKAIDRHRKDLSYNNWDFVVQREVAKAFVAQVLYTASQGHHLFDSYTVNLINPVTRKRPLSGFGSFGFKANDGNDNVSALQASLQRRFIHGLLLQANYMWSHGITVASIGSGESVRFQDMACRACDRSSTTIDMRHTFVMNGIYQLPFGSGKQFLNGNGPLSHLVSGWELAGIASARTGLPVKFTVSRKPAALPDGNTSAQRPNLVPGVLIYAPDQTIIRGSTRRPSPRPRTARGVTWGATLGMGLATTRSMPRCRKRFRITKRMALNFRAAGYNLLNHPQYGNPPGTGRRPVSAVLPARLTPVRWAVAPRAGSSSCLGRNF